MERDILLVGLGMLVSLTAIFSFYHLLPLFLMHYGFFKDSLGSIYTFLLFTYNFGQLIGGFMLKWVSARNLYWVSTFIVGMLLIILYFPLTKFLVVFVLFLLYLLWGIQLPPHGVIVYDAEMNSVKAFSQIEFFALMGILLGPFLGYVLLNHISLYSVILIAGILEFFVALLRRLLKTANTVTNNTIKFTGFKREIVFLTVFISLAFFVFYSTSDGPFIPAILKSELNMDLKEISLIFGIATLISIIFIPVFYILSMRFGIWYVMGVSVLFHGLFLYLWSKNYSFLILLIIGFIAVQPVYAYFMPLLMDNVSAAERGNALGIVGFISGIVGSLSPMLLGRSDNPFLYTFLIAIIAGFLTFVFPLGGKGKMDFLNFMKKSS